MMLHVDFRRVLKIAQGISGTKAIVTDPPYNIKWKYPNYDDDMQETEYLCMIDDMFKLGSKVLDNGEYFITFINDKHEANYQILARKYGFYKRDHIIWHYTFGQHTDYKFTLSKTHILYFVKGKDSRTDPPYFDWERVSEMSERAKRNDIRFRESGKSMRTMRDVWIDIPRLVHNSFEWMYYGNQLPEKLVERVIAPIFELGGTIIDPFSGTGTIIKVADDFGYDYVGGDSDETAHFLSILRIEHGAKYIHNKLKKLRDKEKWAEIRNMMMAL